MDKNSRIFVAGSRTIIGASIADALKRSGYTNLLGIGRGEPDLTNQRAVRNFFKTEAPEYVFLAAGKSGGINANIKFPASLIYDNLAVECNVIHTSYKYNVRKLLYLASSCSYPRECPQPMKEEYLMAGKLEPTNEAYATAKIAGIIMCAAYRQQHGADFIAAIPANAFGPGDDFSPEDSHVIGALIMKMHAAKTAGADSVEIWGTGAPRREFIFTDDLAGACIKVMQDYGGPEPINLGSGLDVSIKQLAETVMDAVGFKGALRFDAGRPDGMPVKLLDSSKIFSLGWRPRVPFPDALKRTYEYYLRTIQGETRHG